MKRKIRILVRFAIILSILPVRGIDNAHAQTSDYEIYPIPQSIRYGE